MIKTALIAAFLSAIVFAPASAADLCNDAHMKKMDEMIAAMENADEKDAANAALDKSKAAMQKGDNDACMKHMNEAHKAMGL